MKTSMNWLNDPMTILFRVQERRKKIGNENLTLNTRWYCLMILIKMEYFCERIHSTVWFRWKSLKAKIIFEWDSLVSFLHGTKCFDLEPKANSNEWNDTIDYSVYPIYSMLSTYLLFFAWIFSHQMLSRMVYDGSKRTYHSIGKQKVQYLTA